MKQATNIEEQLALLKSRGMIISDEQKAREVLMDIGYYRMGFYFFPFEQRYPKLKHRNHLYKPGTDFFDALALYYYDFNLRNILLQYIDRIEVAFRTCIIYELSNKYKNNPVWFVSQNIINQQFIQYFDQKIYNDHLKDNAIIQRHHKKYINDKYAPAWKTIEFMTLGNVLQLYQNLKSIEDKRIISKLFGINQTTLLENYMETIRVIRNRCAHGSTLYDIFLIHSIRNGPAGNYNSSDGSTLSAVIDVILYMIGTISQNRRQDLINDITILYEKTIDKCPTIKPLIEKNCKNFEKLSPVKK